MKWGVKKLGDVAPAKALKPKNLMPDEEVWHLNLDVIESNTGNITKKIVAPISEAGPSTHWFSEQHVLYSKLRPYLNKVVMPNCRGLATTELVPLLPNPDLLDRAYLAHYLRSDRFLSWVNQQVAGAKMPRVSMKAFWEHEIPLPYADDSAESLAEQKRIVAILDKANSIRDKRQQAIELADKFLRDTFLTMFGDPVTNPKQWKIIKLRKLAKLTGGYAFKSKNFVEKGIPIVKITNVHVEDLEWDETSYIAEEAAKEHAKFNLNEGDLLFAMTRPIIKSLDAVKLVEVKKNDLPCLLNQRVGKFQLNDTIANKAFFKCFVLSKYFKDQIEKLASVALQPNVSSNQVEDIDVIAPPLEVQNEFEKIYISVRKIINNQSVAIEKTLNLMESLNQKAFKGEL